MYQCGMGADAWNCGRWHSISGAGYSSGGTGGSTGGPGGQKWGRYNPAQDLRTQTITPACSGPSLSLSSSVLQLKEFMNRPWKSGRRKWLLTNRGHRSVPANRGEAGSFSPAFWKEFPPSWLSPCTTFVNSQIVNFDLSMWSLTKVPIVWLLMTCRASFVSSSSSEEL